MTEELQRLWSLHGLDEQRVALLGSLAKLPAQRADLDRRLKSDHARLDQLKARVADLQKVRRDREREIEGVREQERKFQSQLPSVRKNEEYSALLHEIEGAKARRSELETQVLVQMEEEDKVQHERPALEQALAAAEREAVSRRAEIDRAEQETRDRLSALEAERASHLAGLSAPTRSRYERIHASREGRAVVPMLKGACGGCYRNQPPQIVNEARRGDRLLLCDGCGRIVIWPPDTA